MPESENIPVPIIAPTPKTMRSNALRVFFSPDFFDSDINSSGDFFLSNFSTTFDFNKFLLKIFPLCI